MEIEIDEVKRIGLKKFRLEFSPSEDVSNKYLSGASENRENLLNRVSQENYSTLIFNADWIGGI